MGNFKILIVEDDPQIAESLSDMLEILDHKVVGIADSYEDALRLLTKEKVEICLLDIQLRGSKTGIDIAETIKSDFNLPFIFTTAFADMETIKKASEQSPYGYIVKPYGMKDIKAAIQLAMQNFKLLEGNYTNEEKSGGVINRESLFVKTNGKIVRIKIDDIQYVEARGDYALFKTESKGFIVHTTFRNIESRLDSNIFVRVHRSYIININKVMGIEENNVIINNQVIPISRSQRANLYNKLNVID